MRAWADDGGTGQPPSESVGPSPPASLAGGFEGRGRPIEAGEAGLTASLADRELLRKSRRERPGEPAMTDRNRSGAVRTFSPLAPMATWRNAWFASTQAAARQGLWPGWRQDRRHGRKT